MIFRQTLIASRERLRLYHGSLMLWTSEFYLSLLGSDVRLGHYFLESASSQPYFQKQAFQIEDSFVDQVNCHHN